MPVSTFLPLIPLSNPFFPCLLPSCWIVLLLRYLDGVWISWSSCFAGLGGICFRKGKEESVGAGLYPSWMECPSFVVKLGKL